MLKLRNTLLIAILLTLAVPWSVNAQKPPSSDSDGAAMRAWAAVAPGRVEAASKEIKIAAPVLGRIAQVLVRPNDNVFAGELLVRLDDADLQARLAIAETQVAIRKRARDEKAMPRKAAARREAEDAVADTERAVADASAALDRATTERHIGGGSDESVKSVRTGLASLQSKLVQQETDLRRIKAESNTPLPGPTEGDLNVARDELSLAYANLEKTRIRAPIVGTVLKVFANAGELAMPSPDQPLLLLADLSALQVQAELDERDIGQVHIGQNVSVFAATMEGR
jgi:HlyD family secretion protein